MSDTDWLFYTDSLKMKIKATEKALAQMTEDAIAYRKLATELCRELITLCDDPIHKEQLKELEPEL